MPRSRRLVRFAWQAMLIVVVGFPITASARRPHYSKAPYRVFSGHGIKNPRAIAIDSAGNVWVANHTGNSVSEIQNPRSKTPTILTITGGGLDVPFDIAIDAHNNVWVTNEANNSVSVLRANDPTHPQTFTGGGLSNPLGIAVDLNQNVWIANCSRNNCGGPGVGMPSTVTELNQDGVPAPGSPFLGQLLQTDFTGVAVGADDSILITSPSEQNLVRLDNGNPSEFSQATPNPALNFPTAVAVDSFGLVWVADFVPRSPGEVAYLTNESPISNSDAGEMASNGPSALATDGNEDAWVANSRDNTVSFLSFGIFGHRLPYKPPISFPTGMAADNAGNIWIASYGHDPVAKGRGAGSVVEMVGVATAVTTPLVCRFATCGP
ncbi:MAG TPA: NHL repeat-containing protein [Candidatus Binataceae bacterium]|nr:NHL repeat-containing protein [Candidatus Binataceae bacterium]